MLRLPACGPHAIPLPCAASAAERPPHASTCSLLVLVWLLPSSAFPPSPHRRSSPPLPSLPFPFPADVVLSGFPPGPAWPWRWEVHHSRSVRSHLLKWAPVVEQGAPTAGYVQGASLLLETEMHKVARTLSGRPGITRSRLPVTRVLALRPTLRPPPQVLRINWGEGRLASQPASSTQLGRSA